MNFFISPLMSESKDFLEDCARMKLTHFHQRKTVNTHSDHYGSEKHRVASYFINFFDIPAQNTVLTFSNVTSRNHLT